MVNILCFHGCGQDSQIFSSLLKNLQKTLKSHKWEYIEGKFPKKVSGFGWYKYRDIDQTDIISSCYSDIIDYIINPSDTILIGFSEGGQFVLDIAQTLPNIRGVVAMSPSYNVSIPKTHIHCPVIFIYSNIEDKYIKKSVHTWKKQIIGHITEITHNKGHKIYLPEDTRNTIKNVLKL